MARVMIVMGVSGAGKSAIAMALATRLGGVYVEADHLHPASNIDQMRRGLPLTDAQRQPWLIRLCQQIQQQNGTGAPVIAACSALKRRYRDLIRRHLPGVQFVFLDGSEALIRARLAARQGHFMPPALLASQFADLEIPTAEADVLHQPITAAPNEIVAAICAALPTPAAALETDLSAPGV